MTRKNYSGLSDLRMKKLISIFIFCLFPVLSWGATYHVRADGTLTAMNKANATSCKNAGTALSMKEFNATTFSGGDRLTSALKAEVLTQR